MALTPLEALCLDSFRRAGNCWPQAGQYTEADAWLQFALAAGLHASRLVRAQGISPLTGAAGFKQDASPVTRHEHEIESIVRSQLARFCPDAAFVGEETGGQAGTHGYSVAVDPIDGTWSLLNRTASYSVVIAVFRDGQPLLGVVASPATGEIGYAIGDCPTRLIQLDVVVGNDLAADLPLDRVRTDSILVNVQPSQRAGLLVERLMSYWRSNRIQLVRMEGGSPSAAMLDVAKGSFTYVNLWDTRTSKPFDLAPGILLVRNAGGRVIDRNGHDIDHSSHAGPFVAGLDAGARDIIVAALLSLHQE